MFSRIMELIDKPAGYTFTIGNNSWVRVPEEDSVKGRPGQYINLTTFEVLHAEGIFDPKNWSVDIGGG